MSKKNVAQIGKEVKPFIKLFKDKSYHMSPKLEPLFLFEKLGQLSKKQVMQVN